MTKPNIKIHDLATGEEVEREMTSEEYKEFQAEQKLLEVQRAERLAKEEARQSALEKLAALGLTEAEIAALAGN